MGRQKEQLLTAREHLITMVHGIEPFDNKEIPEDSFLNDPRMIRSFSYVINVLTDYLEGGQSQSAKKDFYITPEELEQVRLPDKDIGISEFCRLVNQSVCDPTRKNLSAVHVNSQLKKMGILGEETTEEGTKSTVTNEQSEEYGITMTTHKYQGREYQKILYNDEGKQFLLDNLPDILDFESKEVQAS